MLRMPLSDSGPVGIPEASQKARLAHTFVPKQDHLLCNYNETLLWADV